MNMPVSADEERLLRGERPLSGLRAAYFTLGCKLNFAETATLSDRLAREGVVRAKSGEVADLCIVNTCSVTETSDHKCRQTIHRAVRNHPGAYVVVTGCYAQLSPNEVAAIEGVGVVVGMEDKGRIVDLIKAHFAAESENQPSVPPVAMSEIRTFVPSCSRGERTRYFLKVQDGCNYFCSYCTIPYARGRSRNGAIVDLVAQARKVAERGGKEIVITGVNIGDFGRSTGETFIDLIRELDQVDGISRYRISSIEPNLLTPEVIDFCASSRAFMPHFHIPLQSGSDEVLRLMRRRYDTCFFSERISYVRQQMPDAFIGVDVIVGTRGETDECFEESFHFCDSLDVAQFHVFSYSERPGTAALRIPHMVPEPVKHQRSQRLIALSEHKRRAFYARYVGTERMVLLEHARRGDVVRGFTDNYVRVELPAFRHAAGDNQLLCVHLGGFNADGSALIGKIV